MSIPLAAASCHKRRTPTPGNSFVARPAASPARSSRCSPRSKVCQPATVATGAISTTGFRDDALRAKAENPALLATEAADYLVRKGIAFRQAHDLIGKILKEAEHQKKMWTELSLEDLRRISPAFDSEISGSLTLEAALSSKKVPGGTALESVRAAITELESRLPKEASAK